MKEEIAEKIERVVRLCHDQKLAGVLINTQPNFAWLTAGGSNGVDSSRENGVATLFIRSDAKRFLLANRIEVEKLLDEELRDQEYEAIDFPWEQEKANPRVAAELAQTLIATQLPIGADLGFGEPVRMLEGEISRLRYQLTNGEIVRLREFGREAGVAISAVARSIPPGVTEREVARVTMDSLARIQAAAVVMLVAADERLKRYRHPVPKDCEWKRVLMIVVCARRGGLIVSLTRIVCVGAIPEELRHRTRASAHVNATLFAATRPGATGSELYRLAAAGYEQMGFRGEEKLHHQGGATGYRTRDWVAHPLSTDKVLERQAFAWNPSATGSKVEETCIAFDDGIEIITSSPDWPSISVNADGRTYELPDVLSV